MKKSKGTMKQKAMVLLGAVTALCALLGGALLPRKVSAESATAKWIDFHAADTVNVATKNDGTSYGQYILYDTDNNRKQSNGESYIYPNNRFLPGTKYNAVLLWTAPAAGTVSCSDGTVELNANANRDTHANADGIRWSLLKVGTDDKYEKLTENFYNALEFKAKEKTTASFSIADLTIKQGEKIAVVVDCGTANKNQWDEATIKLTLRLTTEESKTATDYAFQQNEKNVQEYLTAYTEALFNAANNTAEEETASFEMGVEATNYYSWGASTFTEKQTLTADIETSEFKQTNLMDGKTENELVYKTSASGQWFVTESNNLYSVAVDGRVAKICAPAEFHDTQLVWKAPEAGVFSLDSLALEMAETKDGDESDGMKYAVLYKNAAESQYYDLYESGQIDGDAPWHELVWKEKQTITTLPDFAMEKNDEFIVMFNRKATNTLDSCKFDITISFAATGEEATTYEIKQDTSTISTQGANNFYFRDAAYTKSIVYKQNGQTIKMDAYTDGYTLSDGAVVAVGKNEQFVGWRRGNDLYPAGGAYSYTEGTNNYNMFTAVVITLATEKGAGLRVSTTANDAGIRFVSAFNLSALNSSEYSFGTLVALASDELSETTFVMNADGVKNIPAVNYKTADDGFTQNAAVTAIPEANYSTELQARGYVTVTYKDGENKTFYANLSEARSVAYVAYNSYNALSEKFDLENNAELKAVVDAFKNAYQAEE